MFQANVANRTSFPHTVPLTKTDHFINHKIESELNITRY